MCARSATRRAFARACQTRAFEESSLREPTDLPASLSHATSQAMPNPDSNAAGRTQRVPPSDSVRKAPEQQQSRHQGQDDEQQVLLRARRFVIDASADRATVSVAAETTNASICARTEGVRHADERPECTKAARGPDSRRCEVTLGTTTTIITPMSTDPMTNINAGYARAAPTFPRSLDCVSMKSANRSRTPSRVPDASPAATMLT